MLGKPREWMLSCMHACVLIVLMGSIEASAAAQSARSRSEGEHAAVRSFADGLDRASVVDIQGLDNPDLALTSRQRSEIEQHISAYLEEHRKISEQFPVVRGQFPSAESIISKQAALVKLTTALGKVMDEEQRKTWQIAQAARLKPRDPNGGLHPAGN